MNAVTTTSTASASSTFAVVLAVVLGLGIVTIAGHVQGETLHDAAHDVRHATGFPCH